MSVTIEMNDIEALKAELAAAKAKIAELETSKPAKRGRKAAEKSEAQVKHETIAYEAPETALGKLQMMGHEVHVYAAPKAFRMLPWDRASRLLFAMAEEIATEQGVPVDSVIEKITTRTERAKKEADNAETASSDAPAESDSAENA